MSGQQFAKYTFFEVATMKGYLLEVWGDLLPRHVERMIGTTINGDEFLFVARFHGEEVPIIEHRVTGRSSGESTKMWRDRVRGEIEQEWAAYTKRRAEFLEKQQAALVAQQEEEKEVNEREERRKALALKRYEEAVAAKAAGRAIPPRVSVPDAEEGAVDKKGRKSGEAAKPSVKAGKAESVPSPRSAAN